MTPLIGSLYYLRSPWCCFNFVSLSLETWWLTFQVLTFKAKTIWRNKEMVGYSWCLLPLSMLYFPHAKPWLIPKSFYSHCLWFLFLFASNACLLSARTAYTSTKETNKYSYVPSIFVILSDTLSHWTVLSNPNSNLIFKWSNTCPEYRLLCWSQKNIPRWTVR